MRVLLCHQPTDGGVGRHVRDLVEGLSEAGHEVVVAAPARPIGIDDRVEHRFLDLRREVAPLADARAVIRMAGVVRGMRPDVVHAHSSKAGAVARLARPFFPSIPVLYTPHGYAFAGHFSRAAERLAYREAEQVLAPFASRVMCVCEAEARLAASIGPRDRVRVIHNGVAPAGEGRVDPRLVDLARRGPVIGALTLLRPGKGVETLMSAVPQVLARHPRAQVAIVGDGPDLEELSARARALGVGRAVSFLGPSDEPLSTLRGMDVFVQPSWAEALPYVVLEAMSLARPIVASDVGGIGEAVIHGDTGLLTPPRDEQALARALIDLLARPDRAAQLGSQALQRVSRQFTLAGMLARVTGVYQEVERPARAVAPTAGGRTPAAADGLYSSPGSDDD